MSALKPVDCYWPAVRNAVPRILFKETVDMKRQEPHDEGDLVRYDSTINEWIAFPSSGVSATEIWQGKTITSINSTVSDAGFTTLGGAIYTEHDLSGGIFTSTGASSNSAFLYTGTPDARIRIQAVFSIEGATAGKFYEYRMTINNSPAQGGQAMVYAGDGTGIHVATLDYVFDVSSGDEVDFEWKLQAGGGGPFVQSIRGKSVTVSLIKTL